MTIHETAYNEAGDKVAERVLRPGAGTVNLDYQDPMLAVLVIPDSGLVAGAVIPGSYRRTIQVLKPDKITGEDRIKEMPGGRILTGSDEINGANLSGVPGHRQPDIARVEISSTPNPPPAARPAKRARR